MVRKPGATIAVEVIGARTHNLKRVSCKIPHGCLTVVTGPSGAGKSSLAFDTVYAEAQRRYVESMSTYARQFLAQVERPPVDAVVNILPAVALEARNQVRNARSTVGTLTEVQDVLRLLYTHLGQVGCPNGHGEVRASTPQEVASFLSSGQAGTSFLLIAKLSRPPRQATAKLQELIRQGYFRVLREGETQRLTPKARWLKKDASLSLLLAKFRPDSSRARIAATVEDAYSLTGGRLEVLSGSAHETVSLFGRGLTCPICGAGAKRPTPALFSFNSPLGACSECQGFGRVIGIDPERVIPDPRRTLEERPIAPWNSPAYEELYPKLFRACRERGLPLDLPWDRLSDEDRLWIWSGKGSFTSLDRFFAWLERRIYKMHVRVLLSRYRSYNECPECAGLRLKPAALGVTLAGETLPEITARSIEASIQWLDKQRWTRQQKARSGHLLDRLRERLETLDRVGLGYLDLDRQARTLSGGEAQRIQLAAALGSGLTSTLYVLDEPTIGLHPKDSDRLLSLLKDLARRGNTVLVVEHDRTLIEGADHVIDLGPKAGVHGGELMVEGSLAEILAHETSLTALYLGPHTSRLSRRQFDERRRRQGQAGEEEVWSKPRVAIHGAKANNLRGFDVEIPLGAMVAVSGVSGSGKSTLVENVLHGTYQRSRGVVDVEPGHCDALEGLDHLADVTLVDQRPLGRSSRSNPVTYIKAYDEIRKLFAATETAKREGISAGHFSFNLDKGRCPECQGTGVNEVDMQFMAAVTVVCDVCQGKRFQREILEVRVGGRNIQETLELTVASAREVFKQQKRLYRRLGALMDVGLGYLHLGQPTSTLSGGEAQRLKLASFLDRPASDQPRLFLFDEPTTGLHLSDIDLLCGTLRQLVQKGHGVVVVEHSLELIAQADWVIDLGPGGGKYGGELLYSGPIEEFLDRGEGPTAELLRRHLRWRRRKTRSGKTSPRSRRAS